MSTPKRHHIATATVLALVLVVAACGSPRSFLSNSSVSACYRAIPTARAAVRSSHATLIGVHRVPADRVQGQLSSSAQTTLSGDQDTSVCTLAFKGAFAPGQVEMAPSNEQGRYALVLVTSRDLRVVASVVLDQLPPSLGKRTI
jgi:hypothetical protein